MATDRQIWDGFGQTLALTTDFIFVTALYEDGGVGDPLDGAGAVYLFGDPDSIPEHHIFLPVIRED